MGVAELLRSYAIHARDLLSLALQETDTSSRRAPPLILPREGCVVIALGHIKGIIKADSLVLFDPHLQGVRCWLESLAGSLSDEQADRREQGQTSRCRAAVGEEADTVDAPFELAVLEEAIRELCETYQRRVCLYRPLADALLAGGEDLLAAEMGLHRVVLLKDSLSNFELEVSDLMSLLQSLLSNNEDMLGLLLTASEEAKRRGQSLDTSLHDEVELMLENYHRQLALCLHDIVSMQRHVQSKQEFMAISLDVHRNRMARINVHLGIGAVSLGLCTTIAGYFGMNLPIPSTVESIPGSFLLVTGTSIILASATHALCAYYLGGAALNHSAEKRLREIHVLQAILGDMNRIDFALKSAAAIEDLSKAKFREALGAAAPGPPPSELEVDILFRSLDRSGDGLLQPSEFRLLMQQQQRQGSFHFRH